MPSAVLSGSPGLIQPGIGKNPKRGWELRGQCNGCMFFPAACHKQRAFSKSRSSLLVSGSRALGSKWFCHLGRRGKGRASKGRYSRAITSVTAGSWQRTSLARCQPESGCWLGTCTNTENIQKAKQTVTVLLLHVASVSQLNCYSRVWHSRPLQTIHTTTSTAWTVSQRLPPSIVSY